ncbi:hypothetical protein [Bacillus sp. AFS029533]|nr:hypothetical protein [Bacillus sp. AFS029533]
MKNQKERYESNDLKIYQRLNDRSKLLLTDNPYEYKKNHQHKS